jgi:hypothetical protein
VIYDRLTPIEIINMGNRMQNNAAKNLDLEQRKNIALKVISNTTTITQAANENHTSRKFIEQQKNKALQSINNSFTEQENNIICYLPITKSWIEQMVLSLTMFSKASYRNTISILDYLFNYKISIGGIFNIINKASNNAEEINNNQDLSNIKEAAIDEIFLNNQPILTGVDLYSTYCFMLKDEDNREGSTWEKHLRILHDQGLEPNKFIADFGAGLRSGLNLAYPNIPCNGDVFHVLFDLKKLALYFKNREKSRNTIVMELLAKLNKAKHPDKKEKLLDQIKIAKEDATKFCLLSSSIATLVDWMAHDVLSIAGSDPKGRNELYNFIVDELKLLEKIHPHRIKASRITLENQKDNILAFTLEMDARFIELAEVFKINKSDLWDLCELNRCQRFSEKYYKRSGKIRERLGNTKYIILMGLVAQIIKTTTRSSSLVENLNSRIRPFCNLRKQMGAKFSELLKFFLNHNALTCSRKKERKNKTPAEILNKKSHPHWLEMLGFDKVSPILFA